LCTYAALSSRGDRRAAAALIERAADELAEAGEVAEAVTLYRMIVAVYDDLRCAPRAHLKIGRLLAANWADIQGAIGEYRQLVRDYPDSKEADLVAFELIAMEVPQDEVLGGQSPAQP